MTRLRIEHEGALVGHADAGPDGDRFALTYDPSWLSRDFANLSINELLVSRLARQLGLEVAGVTLSELVCTRAYPRLDRRLAFSIGGERDTARLTKTVWRRFAEDLGVGHKLVLRELEAMVVAAPAALERAAEGLDRSARGIPQIERVVAKQARAIRARLAQ